MTNQDNQREAVRYAYLAGIIDGEGTIRITKDVLRKNPNWTPRYNAAISLGMSERKIIELLISTFTPNAKVRIERVPNRKEMYRWGTSGTKIVLEILAKLLPYLVVKKAQAELVIEFCRSKKTTGFRKNKYLPEAELRKREEFYLKVKKLNATGALATTK